MNTVLVTAGVVCLIAAVIGGRLKAFKGLLGIAFVAAAAVFRDDGGGSRGNEAEARYQRQVVGTCNAMRTIAKRSELGTPQPGPNGFTFDRDALVSAGRANLAAIERRLALCYSKSRSRTPLTSRARLVRNRKNEFVDQNRRRFRQGLRSRSSTPSQRHYGTLQTVSSRDSTMPCRNLPAKTAG